LLGKIKNTRNSFIIREDGIALQDVRKLRELPVCERNNLPQMPSSREKRYISALRQERAILLFLREISQRGPDEARV
jgi:hypothetical protein